MALKSDFPGKHFQLCYHRTYRATEVSAVNRKAIKLVWGMVLSIMAGENDTVWGLYEEYIREKRLHVTIREILEAKGYRKIA